MLSWVGSVQLVSSVTPAWNRSGRIGRVKSGQIGLVRLSLVVGSGQVASGQVRSSHLAHYQFCCNLVSFPSCIIAKVNPT